MDTVFRAYVEQALKSYEAMFGRQPCLDGFEIFCASHNELYSRKNLSGHVTGSAVVLHEASNSILRVHHAKLDKWVFSAGGHIDPGELPWQASMRELWEELQIEAQPLFDAYSPVPFILDVQPIPVSISKREPAHWHYDMIYLYRVTERPNISSDPLEVKSYKWIPIHDVTLVNSSVDFTSHLQAYKL